ncbi:MAG TPA: GNAT family N-acetyltransferase [Thermoanaerobaculia bacterium]
MPGPDVVYRRRGADALVAVRAFVERLVSAEYDAIVAEVVRNEAASIARNFDAGRDALLTAERDGRIVGVLLMTRDLVDPAAARFDWLVVDGSERNGGVGRELLFRGIETCRERRHVVLRARSFAGSPAGPHLYWLFGFRVVDLVPVTIGEGTRESILFEKRLSPPAVSPEA